MIFKDCKDGDVVSVFGCSRYSKCSDYCCGIGCNYIKNGFITGIKSGIYIYFNDLKNRLRISSDVYVIDNKFEEHKRRLLNV